MTAEAPSASALLRHVSRGRVWWAMPHRVLEETPERVVLALLPGAQGRQPVVPDGAAVHALANGRWQTADLPWHSTRVVRVTPFDAPYSVDLWWRAETNAFLFWHINLQQPLRRTALGFDTWDQLLDVRVTPDGHWSWKDEDELAEAVALGVCSTAEAAAVRAAGEQVIASLDRLLPTGYERWQPPADWPPLALPDRWDETPAASGLPRPMGSTALDMGR